MAVSRQDQRTQQTGALAILFVLLAAIAIVTVILAAFVIPDTVSAIDTVRGIDWTTTTN
ncbi:MAG: hypothetical protein OXF99_04155 [bacterium]|nr:hypothetical protein [bacterium]